MSRALLVASMIGFALLLGCGGPEKELPKSDVIATDRKQDVEPAAPVPTTSQPDAVKFVEKCLATVTDGHPERLQKAKINRLTEQGSLLRPTGFIPASRKISAAWPDRFLFTDEFNDGTPTKIAIGLHNLNLSFRRNDEPFDPGLPKEQAQVLLVDSIGQHWMPTLVPLTDPKTIVFGLKKQSIGKKSWDAVEASVPNCPLFTLWFDEKTGMLGVVTYTHLDGNSKIHKTYSLADHKPHDGILLPTRAEFERGTEMVERWTITSWEFLDKIDDAVFDQPVKK